MSDKRLTDVSTWGKIDHYQELLRQPPRDIDQHVVRLQALLDSVVNLLRAQRFEPEPEEPMPSLRDELARVWYENNFGEWGQANLVEKKEAYEVADYLLPAIERFLK